LLWTAPDATPTRLKPYISLIPAKPDMAIALHMDRMCKATKLILSLQVMQIFTQNWTLNGAREVNLIKATR
jgi:hypothetical protein